MTERFPRPWRADVYKGSKPWSKDIPDDRGEWSITCQHPEQPDNPRYRLVVTVLGIGPKAREVAETIVEAVNAMPDRVDRRETGMEDGQGNRTTGRGGDRDVGCPFHLSTAGGPAMTEKRYCPVTGQFEDHFSGECCNEPIMHIMPVEDIMDAYRQMARMQSAHLLTASDWGNAMRLLELAEKLVTSTDKWDDPAWMAQRERFEGRLRALR